MKTVSFSKQEVADLELINALQLTNTLPDSEQKRGIRSSLERVIDGKCKCMYVQLEDAEEDAPF